MSTANSLQFPVFFMRSVNSLCFPVFYESRKLAMSLTPLLYRGYQKLATLELKIYWLSLVGSPTGFLLPKPLLESQTLQLPQSRRVLLRRLLLRGTSARGIKPGRIQKGVF